VVGTPTQVADEFERWVSEADVDGFNIAYAIKPGTFIDVAELLIPELKRRGIFWDDYAVPGGTYRENLTATKGAAHPTRDHPASKYQWRPGVSAEDAIIPSDSATTILGSNEKQAKRNGADEPVTPSKKRTASNGLDKSDIKPQRKSARHSLAIS
jgi:hypothetical protein